MVKKIEKKVVVKEVPVEAEPVIEPIFIEFNVVHEKADIIRELSAGLVILGEPFDPDNPDHAIIAAWLVGKNGMLRK